jgi:hypothetical protein
MSDKGQNWVLLVRIKSISLFQYSGVCHDVREMWDDERCELSSRNWVAGI